MKLNPYPFNHYDLKNIKVHPYREISERCVIFVQVLATGLSGLYSSLPRKLNIPADDWHCLTEEDVQVMPDLIMFLNSLEFCNAVVQVMSEDGTSTRSKL